MIQVSQYSNARDAVLTTTYADNEIAKGFAYTAEDYVTFPDGLTYFLIDPSLLTGPGWISLPLVFTADKGPITVTFYEGTDYTGGVDILTFNRNRFKPVRPQELSVKQGATGTDKGTELFTIGGGTSQNPQSFSEGELASTGTVFWNKEDKVLVEVDNQTGRNLNVSYSFTWYEVQ